MKLNISGSTYIDSPNIDKIANNKIVIRYRFIEKIFDKKSFKKYKDNERINDKIIDLTMFKPTATNKFTVGITSNNEYHLKMILSSLTATKNKANKKKNKINTAVEEAAHAAKKDIEIINRFKIFFASSPFKYSIV